MRTMHLAPSLTPSRDLGPSRVANSREEGGEAQPNPSPTCNILPHIAKPLLIHGTINNTAVRILIDTGSDLDFVSNRLMKRLNLPTTPNKLIRLGGAAGTTMDTITHHTRLPLKIPH